MAAAMPQLLDMLPGARGSWERWFTPQQGAIQAAESLITVVVHVFMEECNSIVAGKKPREHPLRSLCTQRPVIVEQRRQSLP